MTFYSTLTVTNGSSIDGNTATHTSSPASLMQLGSSLDWQESSRRSITAKDTHREECDRRSRR